MQWLIGTNPIVRWLDYEVDLQYGQSVVTLKGRSESKRLPRVELCSAKVGIQAIRRGEKAWFMMLRALDAARPHGVDSMQGNGMLVHDQPSDPGLASKWQALLTEYANVFKQPGNHISRAVDYRINPIDANTVLPKPWLYQMSEDELKAVKDMIDDYLYHSWIRPSSGSYGAPVIVIWKNTGKLRIVIDYRWLNKQTRLDSFPIPRIAELLDRLAHAKYFTKIDLASGYHQTKMTDGHEEKTEFLTRYGTYEWLVLPL